MPVKVLAISQALVFAATTGPILVDRKAKETVVARPLASRTGKELRKPEGAPSRHAGARRHGPATEGTLLHTPKANHA